MAAEIAASEFKLWLDRVTEIVATTEATLAVTPINVEELAENVDDLEVAVNKLETYKPTSNRTVTYDYAPAVPVVIKASMLIAKGKRKLPKQETIPQPQTQNGQNSNFVSRKIPEIVITPFDGDVTKFSNFIAAFEMKYGLLNDKKEKLLHLRSSLCGGPYTVVEQLAITAENYDKAMSDLKSQYDHPEEIVSALYRKLENLPPANKRTSSLSDTYYEVQGILSSLEAHKHDVDAFPPLRDMVYGKYPQGIIQQACGNKKLDIKAFQKEILQTVQFRTKIEATREKQPRTRFQGHRVATSLATNKNAEKSDPEKPKTTGKSPAPVKQSTSYSNTTPQRKNIPPCAFCSEIHYSSACEKYKTVDSRTATLKNNCTWCLKPNHTPATCHRTTKCHYCKQVNKHHSSLCPEQFGDAQAATKSIEKPPEKSEKTAYFIRSHKGAHATALVTIQNPQNDRQFKVRALLDNGSNESYIDENAARRMGLKLTNRRNVPVTVFLKDQPITLPTSTTSFMLTNNRNFNVQMVADTTPKIPQQVQLFDYRSFKELYPQHAEKRFINQAENQPIEMLIGSDYYYDLIAEKIKVAEGLYLNFTKFGWMIVGRQPCDISTRATYFQMSPCDAINELCSLETLGIKELPLTEIEEEEKALAQFYENIEFKNDHYEIRWPWRQFPPNLPNNFGLAVGRLKTLQRKLTEESFNQYNEILQSQIDKGVIEDVPAAESHEAKYFLPHHIIETPEKSTSARVVYDGSAKTKDTNSINDQIYKGINLLTNAGKIIIRFRLRRIVIISDLEKAFHALGINPMDRNYVCFLWLWRFDQPATGKNLRILRFLRVLFGIVASPFLLHATIRYHLQKYKKKFRKFVQKLLEDGFVDNFITGFLTAAEAWEFYLFTVRIFAECSMNLRKWASNDPQLREKFEQPDKSAAISVLGVIWNQYEDKIHLKKLIESEKFTLRTVLSTTAQFYDPCGWWSPILLTAKIFLREIHQQYGWDDPLAEHQQIQWKSIQTQLQLAAATSMNRFQCTIEDAESKYSLHVFTDASAKACACAVYLRKENVFKTEVHLLFSKTKLAKIKHIPKLELIAMLLGIKALEYVRDAIGINCKQYLWCDSKCVLSWVENDKLLPVFIQQRVQYFRNVPLVEKRYVASKENAADLPSRGGTIEQMTAEWFSGPKWLGKSQEFWPPEIPASALLAEITHEPTIPATVAIIITHTYPFDIDVNRYSSLLKLLRITAHLMTFLNNFSLLKNREIFGENVSIFAAQHLWIKYEQQNHYHEIIKAINDRKKHELIEKLNLYIDQTGIIRCAGRFKHAPLSPHERSPILMPPPSSSKFTELLITFHHEAIFHAGNSFTLAALRRKFWIPAGRRAIHQILKACKKCKRYNSRAYKQPEKSDLPEFRFQEHATPFQTIGIDTFGPIWSNAEKRYVLLVTDLIIRAVDLELLEDMTSEQILLALRTIIARHTKPTLIVSDNAPQFKVVEHNLKNTYVHQWSWKYIPEHSPWEGGAYERLVGLAKSALLKSFHNVGVTDPVLRTTLAEITNSLNNRPLTYVTNDKDDPEPLTPNHFLQSYFDASETNATDVTDENTNTITERYLITIGKCCKANTDRFWHAWKTHYLQYLREKGYHRSNAFHKHAAAENPKVNTVVLVSEKNIKRNKWHLGRITKLIHSSDGQIRSVMLKTATGMIIRPLTEVYPLEIPADDVDDNPATNTTPADDSENAQAENTTPESEDEWDNPEVSVEEIYVN